MRKELIQKAIDEAAKEGANLVIWDRRDTFTVENGDVKEIEVEIKRIPGALESGLFVGLARTAVVAGDDGTEVIEASPR